MSHSNYTDNYNLPQFAPTDKPAWLTDINDAFEAIDETMRDIDDKATNAASDIEDIEGQLPTTTATANAAKAGVDNLSASVSDGFSTTNTYSIGDLVIYGNLLYRCHTAITTAGAWTGSLNWERISIADYFAPMTTSERTYVSYFNVTITDLPAGGVTSQNIDISSVMGSNEELVGAVVVSTTNAALDCYECDLFDAIHVLCLITNRGPSAVSIDKIKVQLTFRRTS